jgi:imidazoleglycerol-phosphate dehydratase
MTQVIRETRETKIRMSLTYEAGESRVKTGVPFLDHMMITFARYAGLTIDLEATGDLPHHTIEDVAIVAGKCVAALTSETCARYGDRTIPMDEALVSAALDLGGRAFYEGPIPSKLYDHWMRSFAMNAQMTLHIRVLRGTDRHHMVEAAFKAVGLALRDALAKGDTVFSTKGSVKESIS